MAAADKKLPDPCEKLLNTPAATATGPCIFLEYEHVDCQFKVDEPPKVWLYTVDLSNIDNEDYQKQIITMLKCNEQMWSGHLGEIKEVSHRIYLKPGTHPIR